MKFSDDEVTQDDFEEFNETVRFKLKISGDHRGN